MNIIKAFKHWKEGKRFNRLIGVYNSLGMRIVRITNSQNDYALYDVYYIKDDEYLFSCDIRTLETWVNSSWLKLF
ncbi:hypothetical protein [Nostoc phage N1]|nr:hypothetical protein [Nostoc phage N1]